VFLSKTTKYRCRAFCSSSDLPSKYPQAGTEAKWYGNMKMALNGRSTIGTLDGANVKLKKKWR